MNGRIYSLKNYILVTPCKNEEHNLPHLIESVAIQTIRPVLWVIVDDGSNDNTPQITKEAAKNYYWIKVLRLEEKSKRDLGLHLAEITKKGFNFCIQYCIEKGIEYNYLGNVDADLTFDNSFFEYLIAEFEKDSKLGIASGGIILTVGGRLVQVKGLPVDEPSGGDMLIRRKCFEECGGIPQSYAYDAVLKAKSRLKGWKTRRFERNLATEARDVGNAEGYFKGFVQTGKASYYLNFHPIHVFAKGILKSLRRPYYGGSIYIISYLYCCLKRDKQIEDSEIKSYFWNKWKQVYKKGLSSRVIHEAVEQS